MKSNGSGRSKMKDSRDLVGCLTKRTQKRVRPVVLN